LKALQFFAIVLTALALTPGCAHVASFLNKIDLSATDYFIAQATYRGWNLFGIAQIGALIVNVALAFALRAQSVPFRLALLCVLCLSGGLAIFFAFTFPTNIATDNWTTIPPDWESLRWQWEVSHLANAALTLAGFCALALSVVWSRD
jgi:hypothetical protein